ncbi:unnamed protein product [Rotaria socialis]|uniref:Uncharacterized protein n=1 Tax=Rotaria socialis TaxID=392032 RepID=A0A818C493_9BILA|nr:unnamed protein product [Rotaria socialis]CAF3358947.1 unnamed protein product [Rotaria socialis]CAF3423480.1 unnamed protein product [Rotaria socialis]CAF3517696.1 unnamed protein product [Rotaria socialis]
MQSVTLVSCLILAVAILSVNTHPNRDRHHHSSSFDNSTSSSNGTFSSHGNHSHHEHSVTSCIWRQCWSIKNGGSGSARQG